MNTKLGGAPAIRRVLGASIAMATVITVFGVQGSAQANATCGSPEFNLRQVPSEILPALPGSLPDGNPKPGPEILHRDLADAPQLQNTGPWRARPILVSGASSYRAGEFVYQDHLYDDSGARGTATNAGPGTYTYPTNDALYARNAADLVELRLKPVSGGTAFRLTYNTMIDPDLVATTVTLGESAGLVPIPHGANAYAPADLFVTVHGRKAHAVSAETGEELTNVNIRVLVDPNRRHVHFCVPHEAFDPRGNDSVRVAAATGLWDLAGNRYFVPGAVATATTPGGADPAVLQQPTAFFNVAFRFDEPLLRFRTNVQGTQLASGDLSPFHFNVDFTALDSGTNDDMTGQRGGVPETGYMNRILASHFEPAQGRGNATTLQPDRCPDTGCPPPDYAGRLQPYEIYVPDTDPPYGLMVHPHAAGGTHNFYIESGRTSWQPAAAARGTGSIVFTPNARGPQYWYYGLQAAEVFEVWADIARHYRLDPGNTVLSGLSMGGYGALKLGSQFPDLFSSMTTVVPCVRAGGAGAGESTMVKYTAPSLRHVPLISWTATNDTLCTYSSQGEYFSVLEDLGYRYDWYSFPASHASFDNEFQPLVDWIDDKRVVRDPARVTYVVNGQMNEPQYGLVGDKAYWASGIKVRDTSGVPPVGIVDAFSRGFGTADPVPNSTVESSGVWEGNYIRNQTSTSWTAKSKSWAPAPTAPVEDRLDLEVENIAEITIDPIRARISCDAEIVVESDGPVTVILAGCDRRIEVA
jgi:hypothetical protein